MSYGDVRDVLATLPHDGPHHRQLPLLYPVRERLIRRLRPRPQSVFEFGTLLGWFLVTAISAAPTIRRVGWVDYERDLPGSNSLAAVNVRSLGRDLDLDYGSDRRAALRFGQADLVQVDGDHSYDGCLHDLLIAHTALHPRWILVDDWTAPNHQKDVQEATRDFVRLSGAYRLRQYETENGLAVLTRRPHL